MSMFDFFLYVKFLFARSKKKSPPSVPPGPLLAKKNLDFVKRSGFFSFCKKKKVNDYFLEKKEKESGL